MAVLIHERYCLPHIYKIHVPHPSQEGIGAWRFEHPHLRDDWRFALRYDMTIPYDKKLKQLSRNLRNNSTFTEVLLWNRIKRKQLGVQFNRQKPIKNYIVDFYCRKLGLAIEIDGATHFDKEKYDKKRLKRLNELGIAVLRFGNHQVMNNLDGVVEEIKEWTKKHRKSKI